MGLLVAAWGQERPAAEREVAGVVRNAATGQPVEGATAAVSDVAGTVRRAATTGADGRFRFSGVKPMERVTVWKRGYRLKGGGDVWTRAPLSIEGEAEVELTALGAIAGRVTDENGEALMGITVQALERRVEEGRRKVSVYATFQTDDLGQYRLWHITPGRYFVKALGRRATISGLGPMPQTRDGDLAYGPQYFPSGATEEEASVVEVEPGGTVEADFRLSGQKGTKVAGRMTNYRAYEPVEVELRRGKEAVGSRVMVNQATGAFQATGVAPGEYTVVAKAASKPAKEGRAAVRVGAEGVEGLVVRLAEGVEVRGRMTGAMVHGMLARGLSLVSLDAVETETLRASPVQEEGAEFRFEGVKAGRYRVNFGGVPVEGIRSGTTDVLGEGLTVTEAGCEPLEITLSAMPGSLEVEVEGGKKGVWVGAVKRAGDLAYVLVSLVPDAGKAGFGGLSPGDYKVYAWREDEPLEYMNAAALEAADGVAVVVKAGETATVRVTAKAGGAQ